MTSTVKSAARRAIERLHRRDMQASKDGDFETLRSLVDDEAVMFPPAGAPQRQGRLERENARLKNLVGELALELKKSEEILG